MDAKKAMLLVGTALVLFFTITQTDQTIAAVNWLLGSLHDGAAAIIDFFRDLFG